MFHLLLIKELRFILLSTWCHYIISKYFISDLLLNKLFGVNLFNVFIIHMFIYQYSLFIIYKFIHYLFIFLVALISLFCQLNLIYLQLIYLIYIYMVLWDIWNYISPILDLSSFKPIATRTQPVSVPWLNPTWRVLLWRSGPKITFKWKAFGFFTSPTILHKLVHPRENIKLLIVPSKCLGLTPMIFFSPLSLWCTAGSFWDHGNPW